MNDSHSNKILGTISAEDFVGRETELDLLRRHARRENASRGLLLLSAPASGSTELLKQTYDRLFQERNNLIPFYFAVRASDKTAKNCARRFLQTYIAQALASHHQNEESVDLTTDFSEIAFDETAEWINRWQTANQIEIHLNDARTFIRNCLLTPFRSAAAGANIFVMVDNLHEADFFCDDFDFIEEIKEVLNLSGNSYILAGRRRFLLKKVWTGNTKLTDAKILSLESLDNSQAGTLVENLAAKYSIETNEQTRDLIVQKFHGNPAFIKFLLQAANEKQMNLDSFQRVEQIYTDELFGGRIGKFYDSVLDKIAPDFRAQKEIITLFHNALTAEDKKSPVESWIQRFDSNAPTSYRIMSLLNVCEIIHLSSNQVEPTGENETLSDYFTARFRLEIAAENRAVVVGKSLSVFLKRAPRTMAKFYRQKSAINLRRLLESFNSQEIAVGWLDYSTFKDNYKSAETSKNYELIQENIERIRLPQIVYTAHTEAFYPQFDQITERVRSVAAVGFEERAYTDGDETIWLAAEIDSKLEAAPEKAEFWCDRLEMVALNCNFPKYKIWLVAPEGFTPEAMEVLRQRSAFGSSRRQVELLAEFLSVNVAVSDETTANDYEIVMPMGENTELIAVNAVEEIARLHHFAPKAINQMKTALVEACINASEHSLSPDRKIYLKISIEKNKIVITISNRGLRLIDKKIEATAPVEGRRGWGLRLIETLMDEVIYEQVDDGTQISMTKYLK